MSSLKMTFSLASLVLLIALIAMPAMAGKFQAVYDTGQTEWSVTLTLPDDPAPAAFTDTSISAINVESRAPITFRVADIVAKEAGVPAGTKQWIFKVDVVEGVTVAVQLSGYQRVVFPAAPAADADEEAELPETDLVLLAKLKSAPEKVYARYDTVNVVFTFEAASATDKIGAPGMLHESDVDVTGIGWDFRGVSGNNTVMLQATTGATAPATVTLSDRIALAATKTSDGVSNLVRDVEDTAPVVDATRTQVSALSGDRAPADGKWVNAFDIQFTVTDATAIAGVLGELETIEVSDFSADPDVLTFSNPGLVRVKGNDHLVTATPKGTVADGQEVEISVTVADKAGNETESVIATVELAARTAGEEAAYSEADPASGNVLQGAVIVVTFDGDPGTVTADMDATVAAGAIATERKVTIPADAEEGTLKITLTWGSNTQELTYTVSTVDINRVTIPISLDLSGMLDSDDFAVLARAASNAAGEDMMDGNLPNIQRFFARGGTISLLAPDALMGTKAGATAADVAIAVKSIVISEIMWGLDLEEVGAAQAAQQWIEFYNTTADATFDLSELELVFDPSNTLPDVDSGMMLIDQISNVTNAGWAVSGLPGQSGRLPEIMTDDASRITPRNLVSMYRNINYENVRKTDHDADAAKNRKAQLDAVQRDGNVIGSWAASDEDSDVYATYRVGSPGGRHFVGYIPLTATSVPRDKFVINEIGNNSDDAYDWVELRNVSAENQNLRKIWRLSQVTKKDDDTGDDKALATFDDTKDYIVEAGAVVLIVNSDPYRDPDHPLAAGFRVNGTREETTGVTSRYYVDAGLKLQNVADTQTLLILRNSNDNGHLGKPNGIQDVVGTLSIIDNAETLRTQLWPLVATGKPNGDVIEGDPPEFLKPGSVYARKNDKGSGTAEHALIVAGHSNRVGYKRSAAMTAQNAGTPGYPSDVIKANETDLATAAEGATVTISEIMYDRGDRGNLPQWIELYNSSLTNAVNLDGWQLKIENDDDGDVDIRTPRVTIKNLGATIIQPNQTVLLVGYTVGKVSRGSPGRDDFPSNRVINLSKFDALEIDEEKSNRDYSFLSETAFKLTLMQKIDDKTKQVVDVAGNLGADDAAMWELPMVPEGEGRSSIIRRYDKDENADGDPIGLPIERLGTMTPPGDGSGAWVFAANSPLRGVRVNETFYGNADDQGTPGYRAGGPLPVSLSKFRPERLDSGEIVVRWITESELNNAGFNILRSEKRDGEFTQLNTKLIAGQGTTSERTVYEFPDTSAKPNVVYYYQIQDVSLDGKVQTLRQSRIKGYVSPSGKLTTTWGELKALQ